MTVCDTTVCETLDSRWQTAILKNALGMLHLELWELPGKGDKTEQSLEKQAARELTSQHKGEPSRRTPENCDLLVEYQWTYE